MKIIETLNVTKQEISSILSAAGIESTVDDDENSVYAKKGGLDFGVFIQIDAERTRIRLFTYFECKEGVASEDLARFVSNLNNEYLLVRYTHTVYQDGRSFLNGDYDLFYTFGLPVENFIVTLRKFSSVFIDSVRAEDPDDVFFG